MDHEDFLSGLAGGSLGLVLGYPLDTVKTRMQTSPDRYRATLQTFKKIYKDEKMPGYFKGMSSPLVSMGLYNAILFGVYGFITRRLRKEENQQPTYATIYMSGCVGGAATCFVLGPVENIKVKLQVQDGVGQPLYRGPIDCITKLLRSGHLSQVFKGFFATLYREFPSSGLYMVTFEYLERTLSSLDNKLGEVHTPASATLIAGGSAGVAAWASILPIDIVKSRLQADDITRPKYKGFVHCAKCIYSEGGVRIFYTGLIALSLRSFPVNAVTFYVYKYLLNLMKNED
ncbi:SLC25A45 (predicted) [Pycnogonum litorale]